MAEPSFKAPNASRQIGFHQLLVSARKTWLIDALQGALAEIDPIQLKQEILEFAPADVQRILASAGIRDEHVFPTPSLLQHTPTLVGYYRLLLGAPQKTFYGSGTGMGRFRSMEVKGNLSSSQREVLPDFCRAMAKVLGDLVRGISPTITPRDINELPLLTLGSFFQGANNNIIGRQATVDVFLAIVEIVENRMTTRTENRIEVKNAAGRSVHIILASDPDVRIEEHFTGESRPKVAIEIKGGTDQSNAHNRAGEAEKSHQKAKNQGFRDFWTVITKRGLDMDRLRSESPTTNSWFDTAQVLSRQGDDWEEFRSRIADVVGIPLG
jgi:hypothetical protein